MHNVMPFNVVVLTYLLVMNTGTYSWPRGSHPVAGAWPWHCTIGNDHGIAIQIIGCHGTSGQYTQIVNDYVQ